MDCDPAAKIVTADSSTESTEDDKMPHSRYRPQAPVRILMIQGRIASME